MKIVHERGEIGRTLGSEEGKGEFYTESEEDFTGKIGETERKRENLQKILAKKSKQKKNRDIMKNYTIIPYLPRQPALSLSKK